MKENSVPYIFNSMTRVKEACTSPTVSMYVCGITPDGPTHLGHMFTYVTFDVLARYFRFLGKQTTYVQNITDIDDDMLERSAKKGTTWKQLGKESSAEFWECSDALNNLRPNVVPKASEHIEVIDAINRRLVELGVGYERKGNVYFHAEQAGFGKLSGLDETQWLPTANDRGNDPEDPLKGNPLDFLLWQKSNLEEPEWQSSFGPGRPGWHIECSAMSMKYLGETLDIHGGGHDLIFPHHEAEIAQSENATGKPFVKTWMHVAMVKYKGEKMSKSLGNLIITSDLLKRYSPNAIRLTLLSHHYRSSWEYTEDKAQAGEKLARTLNNPGTDESLNADKLSEQFLSAMNDDLDTPRALLTLKEMAIGAGSLSVAPKYLQLAEVLGLKVNDGKILP